MNQIIDTHNQHQCTLVLGVDERTVRQLEGVWPTWRLYLQQWLSWPVLFICDAKAGGADYWNRRLAFTKPLGEWALALWDWPTLDIDAEGMTQRERMLTAFVRVPPAVIETRYWLKLDTDVVATAQFARCLPGWFQDRPALVASAWHYTKPATWPALLDDWADTVPALNHPGMRRMDLPPVEPGQETIRNKRIASWCCYVLTAFSKIAADCAPDRLPIPSQDTYHHYIAYRRGDPIQKVAFKNMGLACITSDRRRKRLVDEVLLAADVGKELGQ